LYEKETLYITFYNLSKTIRAQPNHPAFSGYAASPEAGKFFEKGKITKGIFLFKEGVFPTEDHLRSISLLPNLAKVFERIVAERIDK
jgi:hypothetical protein